MLRESDPHCFTIRSALAKFDTGTVSDSFIIYESPRPQLVLTKIREILLVHQESFENRKEPDAGSPL